MPEPVSAMMVGYGLGCYALLNSYAKGGTAVSSDAAYAIRAASSILASAEESQMLFGHKAKMLSALHAFAEETAADSCAIAPGALAVAESLLRALPDDLPLPEFALEPDGAIELDWIAARHRIFSLSVGPGPRLAFAWLDGASKGHGVERFDGITMPPRIQDGIRALLGNGYAGIRAA